MPTRPGAGTGPHIGGRPGHRASILIGMKYLVLFLGLAAGLDVYYKNFSLNTSFQLPVYTAATDHPASAGRMVVSVGYSFKQTKYLLHGKS